MLPGMLAALRESMLDREPVALATVVSRTSGSPAVGRPGQQAVIWLDREPLGSLELGAMEAQAIEDARAVLRGRQHKLLKYEEASVFVEVHDVRLNVIVGGGTSRCPGPACVLCDFSVTVLDDRPSFVTEERFAAAHFEAYRTAARLPMDQDTFVVLVAGSQP